MTPEVKISIRPITVIRITNTVQLIESTVPLPFAKIAKKSGRTGCKGFGPDRIPSRMAHRLRQNVGFTCPFSLLASAACRRTAYNQPVVHIFLSNRLLRLARLQGPALALMLLTAVGAVAQIVDHAGSNAGGTRILLVLPFDNRTGQPSLEWIREASAEIVSSRLAAVGFASMSRADRTYALDHLGLPQGFHPSRATSLKLAETLDADSIIVGSYITDGSGIVAEAQLVDVPHLRISETVTARGEMRSMVAVFDSLAWKLTRQLNPGSKLSEASFVAADASLHLDAFEQYIRGITESDQQERLLHLNQSVALSPGFSPAWMALGREEYADQQYEQAAAAFAKVGAGEVGSDDALEAGFFRGLSLLFSGDYAQAQESFAAVARVLPLAEVLSNQGVALARQGKDGIPLFRQAVEADPDNADYHFNLAVSLKRRGNSAEALTELAQCIRLHPNDSEAQAVQSAWTMPSAANPVSAKPATPSNPPSVPAANESDHSAEIAAAKPDPLERIERVFDAAAFHQAAQMIDQVEAVRLGALTPLERAQRLLVQARDYLDHGLLSEAERLYQAALEADPKSAAAHAGLAQVHERAGDAEAARKEAVASLELLPSIDAYLVLIRQQIAAHHFYEAQQNLAAALKIDPNNKSALELRKQIEAQDGMKK
jgi:tetratricopeptide (TPR) repeat protein